MAPFTKLECCQYYVLTTLAESQPVLNGAERHNLGLLVDRFRLLLNEYSIQWEHRGATNRPVPYLQWCGGQIISVALLFSVTWLSWNMTVVWWCCRQDMTESMWFQFGDRLQQFSQRFGVPLGVSRLLQGFWLLDHGDFEVRLIYGCLVSSRSIECIFISCLHELYS